MIRRYDHSKDFPMVSKWFEMHGKKIERRDIPAIGFIRNNAAAGFLFETGTSVALIEMIVTNPEVSIFERYNAVREVTKKLLEICRFRKYKVWAITTSRSISRIAESFKFESRGWSHILHKGD